MFTPLVAELMGVTRSTSPALIFETPAGQRTISSITTIIKAKMDSNSMLNMDEAHAEVKTALGTNEDLFNASSAVEALATKVTDVIVAMFADLSTRFGITISDNVTMLVVSEIILQLTNIASKTPDEIVSITTGNIASTQDAKDKMDEVANSMPSVSSATDLFRQGLQAYHFGYDRQDLPGEYVFSFYEFSNSGFKQKISGIYKSTLPTQESPTSEQYSLANNNDDGSVFLVAYDDRLTMTKVETISIGGKAINASPIHFNKTITFSANAMMYKLSVVDNTNLPEVSSLRNGNGTGGCLGISCTDAILSGTTFEVRNDMNIDIDMKTDGTYLVKYNDTNSAYEKFHVFSQKNTPAKGKYKKTTDGYGDVYTFRNVDNKVIFYAFVGIYGNYRIGGAFQQPIDQSMLVFNKIAAEDIRLQTW